MSSRPHSFRLLEEGEMCLSDSMARFGLKKPTSHQTVDNFEVYQLRPS